MMALLYVLVPVMFLLWMWRLQTARRASQPSLPFMRRAIATLDLDAVRKKARRRHRWSADVASKLEEEYRDFLVLIAENGGVISPWSDDLDLFWHEHIIDTRHYADDCKRIFGRFIQHDPHIG